MSDDLTRQLEADLRGVAWGRHARVRWSVRGAPGTYAEARRDCLRVRVAVATPPTDRALELRRREALTAVGWPSSARGRRTWARRWWLWATGRAAASLAEALRSAYGVAGAGDLIVERDDGDGGDAGLPAFAT